MKQLTFLLITSLALAACTSPASKNRGKDTAINNAIVRSQSATDTGHAAAAITSLCFVHVEGNNNQDSTTIELSIKGSTVTGEMHWIPFEKDGRKGILNGTRTGDIINAVWTFKQEGITDTMAIKFRLKNGNFSQKPLKLNKNTGRQQTDEAAGYTVQYQPYGGRRPDKV